tara:strand:- start:232 stop:567 length:336 start_codon:yes stop_codon:yes gene_type:complete
MVTRQYKKVPFSEVEQILINIQETLAIPPAQAIEAMGYANGSQSLGQWREAGNVPETVKWALRGYLHHHKRGQGLNGGFDKQDLQDLFFLAYQQNPEHRLCKKLLPLLNRA